MITKLLFLDSRKRRLALWGNACVAVALVLTGVSSGSAQNSQGATQISLPPVRPASPGISDGASINLPARPIGENDLIAVSVYAAPEFSRSARVGDDGFIRLPMLKNRIYVRGMMPSEAETAIAASLSKEQLLVDPFVTVNIAEYQSRPISVSGCVRQPLTFQATTDVSLLEAITRAGGLSETAGTEILITKLETGGNGAKMALTQRISVAGLIDDANPDLNIRLSGGEEIRVPEIGKIFVVGNVTKPGPYAVQENSQSTVMKMLAVSEGLAPYSAKQAFVYRADKDSGTRKEIPIELRKIMDRKEPDVPLMANDILYIPDDRNGRNRSALLKAMGGASIAATGGIVWALVK